MENTDHKNEAEPNDEELEVKPALAWWQELGIIISSLVLFLIGPLCCVIIANKHRNRAWSEKVEMIGEVVFVPHLLVVIYILCGFLQLHILWMISTVAIIILPVAYFVCGLLSRRTELKPVLFKVGSVTSIFYILIFIFILPYLLGRDLPPRDNRYKSMLCTLGSAMLAFKNENPDKNYGTWEEMTKANYIQEGYSRTNMIDNYSIAVFNVQKSTLDKNGNSNFDSTFTIVAFPRRQRNRLRTFALGDDQTPRLWVGKFIECSTENVSLHNIEMWKPLR